MGNAITASPTDSGSANYARQDVALARSLDRLRQDLALTAAITNYSQDARDQKTRMAANVRVPKRGTHTVKTKAAQTNATSSNTTAEKVDLPIDKHRYVDFVVEDFAAMFVGDGGNYLSGTVQDAVDSLAEDIESYVWANYADSDVINELNSVGSQLDDDFFISLVGEMMSNKFNTQFPTYGFWGARAVQDFLKINKFTKVNESGSTRALREAIMGAVYGINHYKHNGSPALPGSPASEVGLVFQSAALGIAFMDMNLADLPAEFQGAGVLMKTLVLEDDYGNAAYSMRMTAGYSQDAMGTRIQLDTIFGTKVIRPELLLVVRR